MEKYKKNSESSYTLGATVTFELLKVAPRVVEKVYYSPDIIRNFSFLELNTICQRENIPIEESSKAFRLLSPKENCFVIGKFKKYAGVVTDSARHIVLVNPMNAGNLGTIMRTALALGYEDLCLVLPCADPFAPETIRASMGAIFSLKVQTFESFSAYREKFPQRNLYAFMTDAKATIDKTEFVSPYSLIFGNEAQGLDRNFHDISNSVVIPFSDKVDSLNLSVAAAIGMFTAANQKK